MSLTTGTWLRWRGVAVLLIAATAAVGCSSSGRSVSPAPLSSAAPSAPSAPSASSASAIKGTVVVFAAASLKGTFTAIASAFEQAHPGAKIVSSFGGSDTLAAQITQGAPVDVFAAASTTTMDTVTKAGDASAAVNFAKNVLEIAVPVGNPQHIAALSDVIRAGTKLALCAAAVPCGAAATKAFAAAKITPHPVTLEQDVTSVLTKVELGEVDAGLVYVTDVKSASGKVDGVSFPESSAAVNTYPIALVTTGKNPTTAQAFVDFVLSSSGQQILLVAGFEQP